MKVPVFIDSRIRLPKEGISDDALLRLRKVCEHVNPEFSKKRALGYSTYSTPPIIETWRKDESDAVSLPRGVMSDLREIFADEGIAFKTRDGRTEGSLVQPRARLKYVGHEPRPYQVEAAEAALAKEQGIIRAATGSGKTTTALWLAAAVQLNTLIILPSVKLLDQTRIVAEKLLGLRPDQIGRIQGSKRALRTLTLATQQTLWSQGVDEDLREFFGCIVVDEAHHAAARTFGESIDQFPARFRIAFTADEKRKDRMEFLVYDMFGKVLHEMSREDCEEVGAVVDVEVRIVPTSFASDSWDEKGDFNALLDEMIVDDNRNASALEAAADEIAAGEQVIMLTHRREHVRDLEIRLKERTKVRTGRMLGGNDATDVAEFVEARDGLRAGDVRAGIGTYSALGEGIDLPAVSIGVAVTPIATNRQKFNQVRGRLCRPSPGKERGILYVLFDPRVFGEHVLANILSWNRTVKVKIDGRWVDARPHRRAIMVA